MKKWISVSLATILALLGLFLGLPGIPAPHAMAASTFEFWDNDDSLYSGVGDPNDWLAQTFTAESTHTIKFLRLFIHRDTGLITGTITVSIKNTDNDGLPVGLDLTATSEIITYIPYNDDWVTIYLPAYGLTEGKKYAIVIRASDASSSAGVWWMGSNSPPGYTGGDEADSINGGVNWIDSNIDLMFQVNGDVCNKVQTGSPTANTFLGFDTGWWSPANAYTNMDGYAIGDQNVYRLFYGYNFSIPEGSTINGIEVRTDGCYYPTGWTTGNGQFRVALSWNNYTSKTSYVTSSIISGTEATYFIGGPTSTWGRTWSPSDFTNANFRLIIGLYSSLTPAINDKQKICLDYCPITVYYTPPLLEIGDVNEDGIINVNDIRRITNIILLREGSIPGADVNQDGSINVFDITAVARKILGLD
jgi:hypothetical protein